MQHDMKSINLFGQEEHVFTNRRKSQKSIFDDYEGFVEKFNPKKTTDAAIRLQRCTTMFCNM